MRPNESHKKENATMKIISVVGARPNFMKVAPLCRALRAYPAVQHMLVHTGQRYGLDGWFRGCAG